MTEAEELKSEIERLRQRFRVRYFRKHPERIDDERIKIIPCHCNDDTCYGWQATTDEIIEARDGLDD